MSDMSTERERWGSWELNPYYHPEKCGLELVHTIEDPQANYSFDTVILVKDLETGLLYAAQDSGCSCPTPFEDLGGVGDMAEVRTLDDYRAVISQAYATFDPGDIRKGLEKLKRRGIR